MGVNETRRKPASSIIAAKAFGLGNLRIDFDQILIGLAVAGHRPADRRDHVERIELVERVQPRHVDRGEFQAQEAPAQLEHAIGFAERALDARHVADAEGDGDAIEAAVGIGEFLGIALLEGDAVVEPRSSARSAPTVSISVLMSQTVTRVPAPPASTTRKATSPVPPARSSSANGRIAAWAD